MINGIDISKWQPTTPDLTGVSFVIVKASEGLTEDPLFRMHCANVRKHPGVLLMAYHFTDGRISAASQVTKFLAIADNEGVDGYAYDVEGKNGFTTAESKSFVLGMHGRGKKIGGYYNLSNHQNAGQDWEWVADYNSAPPPIRWDIWQYGPHAPNVDGDRFRGTIDELRTLVGGSTVGAFTVPAKPLYAVINQGDWLYDNPTLQPSGGNTQINPGPRNMPVAGILPSGVFLVGYVDTTPTETALPLFYVKSTTKTIPVVGPTPPPITIPPTAESCKSFSDTAYAQGAADGQTTGEKQGVLAERQRISKFLGLDVVP